VRPDNPALPAADRAPADYPALPGAPADEPALPGDQALPEDNSLAGLEQGESLHLQLEGPPGGLRLDAALAQILPGLGLRARRRLWDWCAVRVNGKDRQPGAMALPGDSIAITPLRADPSRPSAPRASAEGDAGLPLPELVAWNGDFLALNKPAGLHSAQIAGAAVGPSLEQALRAHWPSLWAALLAREAGEAFPSSAAPSEGPPADLPEPPPPLLLTRLDRETSGLALAARTRAAAARFRLLEREGRVRKRYLALAIGLVTAPLRIANRLDTADRATTRALPEPDPDPARHSLVQPLRALVHQGVACTLLRVDIARGARHQIRAHLACAGFPLYGDSRYGPAGGMAEPSTSFFLHHAALSLPGFSARRLPAWPFARKLPDGDAPEEPLG
jgi:23S rRNA pseudouridine1911/1915/1917 synthase